MIDLSGPLATYFKAVEVSPNDWRLEVVKSPPSGSYGYTLTETQNGYDNSPRVSTGTFIIAAQVGTGNMTVTTERTIIVNRVQPNTNVGDGIPLGAPMWKQQFDPGDHAPFAIDFSPLLLVGERIAAIEAITMAAQATTIGLSIDNQGPFVPIIDQENGMKIQVWFVVNSASKLLSRYDASGVNILVTFRIRTDAAIPVTWERSGVLNVRQM